jgi:hypothetical protein
MTFILPGYILRYFYLTSGNWALNGTDSIRNGSGTINSPYIFEIFIILFLSAVIHSLLLLCPHIQTYYIKIIDLMENSTSIKDVNLSIILCFLISICLASGELKTIFLHPAHCSEVSNQSPYEATYFPIKGEWLSFKYKDIESLAIEYFFFEPTT